MLIGKGTERKGLVQHKCKEHGGPLFCDYAVQAVVLMAAATSKSIVLAEVTYSLEHVQDTLVPLDCEFTKINMVLEVCFIVSLLSFNLVLSIDTSVAVKFHRRSHFFYLLFECLLRQVFLV